VGEILVFYGYGVAGVFAGAGVVMEYGGKITMLKQAIAESSLTVRQIADVCDELDTPYISMMVNKCGSIEKDGICNVTGLSRWRYNPDLEPSDSHFKFKPGIRRIATRGGSFSFMLPDKLACLRRRMASNYTSEHDKDILQAIYRDYQSVAGG
jgi:hypothetical protein